MSVKRRRISFANRDLEEMAMASGEASAGDPEKAAEQTTATPPPRYSRVLSRGISLSYSITSAKPEAERLKEAAERGNWSNPFDFFLSCLGFAVGLGNVWRFPYYCYKHGGGTFLFPYFCMLFFVGLPMFFLELALGQYTGVGPNKIFPRLAPILRGLGYGMLIMSFFVGIYYNVIIAWTLFYVFAGFASELPWKFCGHDFNTINCFSKAHFEACQHEFGPNQTYWNNTCVAVEEFCTAHSLDFFNASLCSNSTTVIPLANVTSRLSPSEDYYNSYVLGIREPDREYGWDDFGPLKPELVACLLLAWIIVCLCLIKGVQSSGKVVYFTALFPYVVLIILFGRGVTLDGAHLGIEFYTTVEWERLSNINIWADAATQIFFSLGPAFGGLITLASYNKFDNNCHRDAIIIALTNCLTSFFAGFVIFSIVGYMAFTTKQEIKDVIKGGPGLAFIAYPEAVASMPGSQVWSFLFFMMLITLGLDSMFTTVETITTAVLDEFPLLREKKEVELLSRKFQLDRKALVVVGVCFFSFLLGISMCAHGGILMFTLIDESCASWNVILFAFLELTFIVWVYGSKKFLANIEEMGIPFCYLKYYWCVCWVVVCPVILIVLFVTTFVNYEPVKEAGVAFPAGIQALGNLIALSSVIVVPVFGVVEILRRHRKKKPLGWALFKHTNKWGPASLVGSEDDDAKDQEATLHELQKAHFKNNDETVVMDYGTTEEKKD